MKKFIIPALFLAVFTAPAALSHSGVKDAAVMARMQLMSLVANDMKVLGEMAKGSTPFDAEIVQARAASLEEHALETVRLFEAPATDPKSEAKPEIWDDWEGFSKSADEMREAAEQLGLITTEAEFGAAFRAVGQTCSACHEAYRINKN